MKSTELEKVPGPPVVKISRSLIKIRIVILELNGSRDRGED